MTATIRTVFNYRTQIYVMLLRIFFFTLGRNLLYFMRSIFLVPHKTIFGTSNHLLSMLQQLSTTTNTWWLLCMVEAARHGPAVPVIPVFIPE